MNNRIIKFRVWDKKENEWREVAFYVNVINFKPTGEGIDVVFQQFTGLKDKNGKEIYEGDILKISIERYAQKNLYVVSDMLDFYVDCNQEKDNYNRISEMEIVGNIFENPELLK